MTNETYSKATIIRSEIDYLHGLRDLINNAMVEGFTLIANKRRYREITNEEILKQEIGVAFLKIINEETRKKESEFAEL